MTANGLWYGVVRDYEAISYQFIPTFFTSHKPSKTTETRMHYTMCYKLFLFLSFYFFSLFNSFWCLIQSVPNAIAIIPKITAIGLLSVQSQVIWSFLNVNATTKSPHIIVTDINRFLFFIFTLFKLWTAKLICSMLSTWLRKVDIGLKKGWYHEYLLSYSLIVHIF